MSQSAHIAATIGRKAEKQERKLNATGKYTSIQRWGVALHKSLRKSLLMKRMNDRRLSDRRRCRYYRGIAPDGTELTWGSYNATAYQAYMYITRHAGKWFANAVRDEPESGDRWHAGQWIACRRNYKLYIREGMLFEHIADGKVYKVFAVRRDVICYGEPNLAGTEYKTPTDSFHDIVKRVVSNRFFDDEY